jgi:hypothetical protein
MDLFEITNIKLEELPSIIYEQNKDITCVSKNQKKKTIYIGHGPTSEECVT